MDAEGLHKLATLSCLKLSQAKEEALRQDLEHILTMVETLKSVETEGIPPLVTPFLTATHLREDDQPQDMLGESEVFANAPDHKDGLMRVPAFIKR